MLHIGANHLGNIKDIPARVVELLQTVDYVVMEFEEQFLGDIERLQIPTPNFLIYTDNNDFLDSVINLLKDGKSVLLLDEMGYPGIADPGHKLVSLAIEQEIPINIIPGPSIGPVAIAASGFSAIGNILVETFGKESDEIIKIISEFKNLNYPIVLLDHKETMLDIVKLAKEHLPNRKVCLCINLGWDSDQKIIKKDYDDMIELLEKQTEKELFGPLVNRPVTTLVFGPLR